MEAAALDEDALKEVTKTRNSCRSAITMAFARAQSNQNVDMEKFKRTIERFHSAMDKYISHLLAKGEDVDDELDLLEDYSRKAAFVYEKLDNPSASKPLATSPKSADLKLPKVAAEEPSSWFAAKSMIGLYDQRGDAEVAKKLELMKALPADLASSIAALSLDDAIKHVSDKLTSKDAILSVVRARLQDCPGVKHMDDYSGIRSLCKAIESIDTLITDPELEAEASTIARNKVCKPMIMTFYRSKASKKLPDLLAFLKAEIKYLDWYQAQNGTNKAKPVPEKGNHSGSEGKKPFKFNKQKHHKPSRKINCSKATSSDSECDADDSNKTSELYATGLVSGDLVVDSDDDEDDEVFIKATFDDVEVPLLWDPGARKNLLPANLFYHPNMKKRFRSASGHPIRSSGPQRFLLKVNGHSIPFVAYVTENNLAMVGRPFTKKCSVTSDGNRVREIVYHDKGKSKVVYQAKSGRSQRGTNQIFQVLPCSGDDLIDDILPDLMDDGQTGMRLLGEGLKSTELSALLKKWDFLSEGLGDAGDEVMHRIYVEPGTKPISVPPRRLAIKHLDKAEQAIKEMWDQDIIEFSKSPWCANIVPVPKPDGTTRIAIDYGPLNEVSKKDAYPMHRVDEIFEQLSGAKVFSKLDLVKGYYQIRIHPNDREKTKRKVKMHNGNLKGKGRRQPSFSFV